jgi:hypothetical protein
MKKALLVVLMMVCLGGLSGCPSEEVKGAVELTIGGAPVTGSLVNEGTQWYTFNVAQANVGKPLDFVFKNSNQIPVGVELTIYSSSTNNNGDEVQNLEWQIHTDPLPYVNMTNEDDGKADKAAEKAVVVPEFITPLAGKYYICVKGYQIAEGYRPSNTYTFRDTLVYSIAVRFTPDPELTDAVALSPTAQAPAVPFITGYLEPGEKVYHPVTLNKGVVYQIQLENDGPIAGELVDVHRRSAGPALGSFFSPAKSDTYYVGIRNNDTGDFGYAEYRVRVYIDDLGNNAATGRPFDAAAKTITGYLSVDDVDYMVMTIPAGDAKEYAISVPEAEAAKFKLDVKPSTDNPGQSGAITLTDGAFVCRNTSTSNAYKVVVTITAVDDFGMEDGIGSFTVNVAIPQ